MSSMSLIPVQILLSKISKLRFKFHYSSKLRRLLKEAQQKHNLPEIVMPASCVMPGSHEALITTVNHAFVKYTSV